MYDTNTLYVETMPRLEEYEPILLKAGNCICFNGNKCKHFNKINKTGKTRVSFDFRVLPLKYYNKLYSVKSITTKQKFIKGGYYKHFNSRLPNEKIPRDIWDKEKHKFNHVMEKYNVKDAWDIVSLFEKKLAEYAGSTYGISVDNCTDALFLCLKYLKYKGEITIPARTYCSVPCTIINAGCTVKFDDIEWSGAYQLKPTPIYDGAVRMKRGMYKKGTYHCLSFHIRKHLPIGKGGMILCDDEEAYKWFRMARYEGRHIADGVSYKEDTFDMIGWNMYMTPEQAARGLELFEKIGDDNPDQESSGTCKDLSQFPIYTKNKVVEKNKIIYNNIFQKTKYKRLYLGCGNKYIKNFVNVDIMEESKADIISDVRTLKEFDINSIDLIYSCHMIEHVSRHEYKNVLKRWYDIIKPGGKIRLALPDLFALSKYYIENGNIDEVRGCMFGGQKNKYDYHYFGHDFKSLKKNLEEIGFINVKRFDWRKVDYEIKDWSRDYLPKHYENGKMIPDDEWYKGTLVSLNIEATKEKQFKKSNF